MTDIRDGLELAVRTKQRRDPSRLGRGDGFADLDLDGRRQRRLWQRQLNVLVVLLCLRRRDLRIILFLVVYLVLSGTLALALELIAEVTAVLASKLAL